MHYHPYTFIRVPFIFHSLFIPNYFNTQKGTTRQYKSNLFKSFVPFSLLSQFKSSRSHNIFFLRKSGHCTRGLIQQFTGILKINNFSLHETRKKDNLFLLSNLPHDVYFPTKASVLKISQEREKIRHEQQNEFYNPVINQKLYFVIPA